MTAIDRDPGLGFQRARRFLREKLAADGVSDEIDESVRRLLDVVDVADT